MSDIAIQADNLSKLYSIGERERYCTLRETLSRFFAAPFHRYERTTDAPAVSNGSLPLSSSNNCIWALKDVSFEIKRGEVVGIIGRNGAGKSTLLKILSRITEPTSGEAKLYGRVGSLLEVGSGFHSELTGRENIYLNGAILGMTKAEIKRKFDEIVAFAEIEQFIDTPVKRYSSGMYMRLAFAVAAHLESEILLVDEVLAVGDVAFQRKCIGKIGEVSSASRTVLFVSHNMGSILQLCPSSILLESGKTLIKAPSEDVVKIYLDSLSRTGNSDLKSISERTGDGRLRFVDGWLQDRTGNVTKAPFAGDPVDIVLHFRASAALSHVRFMLTIYNQFGVAVTHCNVAAYGDEFCVPKGNGKVLCHIPKLPLPRGTYRIAVAAHDDIGQVDWVPAALYFTVDSGNFFPKPYLPPPQYSTALVEHSWKLFPVN